MSISPTIYNRLFHKKEFCAASLCIQFGFVIFWQKEIITKAACKLLVKLVTGFLLWFLTFIFFVNLYIDVNMGSHLCHNGNILLKILHYNIYYISTVWLFANFPNICNSICCLKKFLFIAILPTMKLCDKSLKEIENMKSLLTSLMKYTKDFSLQYIF